LGWSAYLEELLPGRREQLAILAAQVDQPVQVRDVQGSKTGWLPVWAAGSGRTGRRSRPTCETQVGLDRPVFVAA